VGFGNIHIAGKRTFKTKGKSAGKPYLARLSANIHEGGFEERQNSMSRPAEHLGPVG
jgi:hypothetical protein